MLKFIEKGNADERLEEIKYESEKIAMEGEMARLRSDQDVEDAQILARDGFIGPRPAEPKLVVVDPFPELRAAMGEGSGVKLVSAHSQGDRSKEERPIGLDGPEGKRASGVGCRDLHVRDRLPPNIDEERAGRG